MAAGTSSRFVPLSFERPKGLLEVKGEVLIERQIRQLQEAGIRDITIVVGYKAEMFAYLKDKFDVDIVMNEDYAKYNNTSSVIRVLDRLSNTYICSSDNYFPNNVFIGSPETSYYSARYANGETGEYCLAIDESDNITDVTIGGENAWYMVGHVYFSYDFSCKFREILGKEYVNEKTRQCYWEDVYISHIKELPAMKIHRYNDDEINEFDSIDELRQFDESYIMDTRSGIVRDLAIRLNCTQGDLTQFRKIEHDGNYLLFSFRKAGDTYCYNQSNDTISKI